MTLAATDRLAVPVVIELPATLQQTAEDSAFREAVERYCGLLVESLELPLQIELAISATRSDHRARLVIGENPMVFALPESTGRNVGEQVSHFIYQCREFLVTTPLARRVWHEWFPASDPSLEDASLDGVVCLLRDATRYGLRLGRVQSAVVTRGAELIGRSVAEEIFEQAAGQSGPGSVKIFVSPAQYARNFEGSKARASVWEDLDFPGMLEMVADALFYELGISFHLDKVEIDDGLQPPWFRIQWNDIPVPPIQGVAEDEFLVNDTPDALASLGLKASPRVNPANGVEYALLCGGEEVRKKVIEAGLTTWGPEGYVVLHASAAIRANAGAFVNLALFDLFSCQYSKIFPDLIAEVLLRFGQTRLARILRLLATEEISIRDLRSIFDALLSVDGTISVDLSKLVAFVPSVHFPFPAEHGEQFPDLGCENYADCVRMALRRYLSHKYTGGSNALAAYFIDPEIEKRLAQPLPFSSSERSELVECILNQAESLSAQGGISVILTAFNVRRRLQQLIAHQLPRVVVLSYPETSPGLTIQPIARIGLTNQRAATV